MKNLHKKKGKSALLFPFSLLHYKIQNSYIELHFYRIFDLHFQKMHDIMKLTLYYWRIQL